MLSQAHKSIDLRTVQARANESAEDERPRRLAAIVALDVAGYSARAETDEAGAAADIGRLRATIESITAQHNGRIFNAAGDSFMLEFASGLNAVSAAAKIAEISEPKVRVGVHLGDVIVQANGDLLGHGVNVAARLMAQSAPGSVLASADIRRAIRGPLAERFVPRGALRLDKMAETIDTCELMASAPAIEPRRAPGGPLLAVLPFDNLCDSREMLFFSDGISEEILRALARADGLKVVGRSSSFQYRGNDKTTRKVAQELNASHILDGSVRRSGDQVRISAHLVETRSQTTIWTDRFDGHLSDALQLQDEVASAIADALKATLTPSAAAKQIPQSAYDLYLRAKAELSRDYSDEHVDRATSLLTRAIGEAPDFAKALALLSNMKAALPAGTDVADHDHVRTMAQRAMAIDAGCAESYAALALLGRPFSSHSERLRLSEKAIELAPGDPWIVCTHANALWSVGRAMEAVDQWERAAETQSLSPSYLATYVQLLFATGRGYQALQVVEDAWPRFRQVPAVWRARFDMLSSVGDIDEAEQMCRLDSQLPTEMSRAEFEQLQAAVHVLKLSEDERETALKRLFDDKLAGKPSIEYCLLAAKAGVADIAFKYLFDAVDQGRLYSTLTFPPPGPGNGFQSFALFTGEGKALRRDPRFARLCARLGFVDHWTMGQWPDCADEETLPYNFRAECVQASREFRLN